MIHGPWSLNSVKIWSYPSVHFPSGTYDAYMSSEKVGANRRQRITSMSFTILYTMHRDGITYRPSSWNVLLIRHRNFIHPPHGGDPPPASALGPTLECSESNWLLQVLPLPQLFASCSIPRLKNNTILLNRRQNLYLESPRLKLAAK